MSWWQWWILASVILCAAYSLMRSRQKRRETIEFYGVFEA